MLQQAAASGGARAWFEQQLTPDAVPDPRGEEINTWWSSLALTSQEIFRRNQAGTESVPFLMLDLVRWTVARRLESSRQLLEVMVDFWSNHLNVPIPDGAQAFARVDYDKTIRANALGTFEDLLQATIPHPAMGVYLNNYSSTKTSPNENLGRELLELHTLGVGNFSEADVKNSARILTGFRVDIWSDFTVSYDSSRHYTGPVQVLDFRSQNSSADGRAVTRTYLSYLARHPKTAERIARKLCIRFVSDSPSQAVVSAVAQAYLANGTAIKPTLRALVDHPDFASAERTKLRTPQEDWEASVRALGFILAKPTNDNSFARWMYFHFQQYNASPYRWPRPDGYPDSGDYWATDGRVLNSFAMHRTLAGHWVAASDATLPSLESFLPALPCSLQSVIDVVATALTGQSAAPALARGISTALGWGLDRSVTKTDFAGFWALITIVATILDSPQHLYR